MLPQLKPYSIELLIWVASVLGGDARSSFLASFSFFWKLMQFQDRIILAKLFATLESLGHQLVEISFSKIRNLTWCYNIII